MKNQLRCFSGSLLMLLLYFSGFAQNDRNGNWAGPFNTDLIPVAAANLPDGRLMMWSAKDKFNFGGGGNKTFTAIFNPRTNRSTTTEVSNTGHDMFCPGIANLSDGRILVAGGQNSAKTSIYNPATNRWTSTNNLNTPRGYNANVTMSNGGVMTLGGSWSGGRGNKNAEVWTPQSGWVQYPGITANATVRRGTNDPRGVYRDDNHAWFWAAPNGKVFHAGPGRNMHWLTLEGNGSVQNAGTRGDDDYAMNGNTVMYDVGKIFKTGGAISYDNGHLGSKKSYIIDINQTNPNVSRVPDMKRGRSMVNTVVLPNGEIFVSGGLSKSLVFSDAGAALVAEIFNPYTRQWRDVAAMKVARTYHSVSILLPDARVFVGGGGLCGTCDVNHPDAEVYSPPYLYNGNTLANRPTINTAPGQAGYGANITVRTNAAIQSFVLIRASSATHSTNNEQRRIPLSATNTGGNNYRVQMPNRNIAPPGYYMLFAMNNAGVPSVAKMIKIGAATNTPPPATGGGQLIANGTYHLESVSNPQRLIAPAWDSFNARMQAPRNIPVQQWTINHLGNNVYTLRNKQTNRYLEVPNGRCANRSNVASWTNANSEHQRWIISKNGTSFDLRPVHCTSRGLDRDGGGVNANTHLWPYNTNSANQKWKILQVSGATAPPPPAQAGGDNTEPTNPPPASGAQVVADGRYHVESIANTQRLIAPTWDQHNARMFNPGNFNDQEWNIKHLENNVYTLQNVRTRRYLEVPFGRCGNNNNVATWTSAGSAHQRWIISKNGTSFNLRPVHCESRGLDRAGGAVNANAILWNFNVNNANQKWKLIRLGASRSIKEKERLSVVATSGRQVKIAWVFGQDKAPVEYVVEYAEDDEDFEILKTISAKEGTDIEAYQFIHDTPHFGYNHYQILIRYADGSTETIPFETIYFDKMPTPIAMFPNPSKGSLYLDLSDYKAKKINYLVANLNGKVLLHGQFLQDHLDQEQLQLTGLENGSYLLFLRPEGQREIVQKVVVMKEY